MNSAQMTAARGDASKLRTYAEMAADRADQSPRRRGPLLVSTQHVMRPKVMKQLSARSNA
jgi:hypothetical protein